MTFEDAIKSIKAGNKVTRQEWRDRDVYGILLDGKLCIKNGIESDGKYHPWIISDGDLFAEDWEVADA